MLLQLQLLNPGSGTLSVDTNPLTASSGVSSFSGVKIDKAGVGYTLIANAAGLTSAASNSFTVSVGAAAQVVSTQWQWHGGTNLSTQPVIEIQDAGGNLVPTLQIIFCFLLVQIQVEEHYQLLQIQ